MRCGISIAFEKLDRANGVVTRMTQIEPGVELSEGGANGRSLQEESPLNVLLLIDGMEAITAGGTERQLLQLVHLAKANNAAPQICILRDTRWLTEEMAGCPVRHYDLRSLGSATGMRQISGLLLWLKAQKFDILQTFFSDANLIGPLLGRLAGIPVIVGTRRNLNEYGDQGSLLWRAVRRLSNRAVDQILTNSQAVLERVVETERFPREKIAVVYNGVDIKSMRQMYAADRSVRKELRLTPKHVLVGNVSGLRKVKAIEDFVEAAEMAYRRAEHLRFVVVGEGETRGEIERLIYSKRLGHVITLAGAQEDVRPYLAAMDIGVLCSTAEGFSNSLLEYMANGLPVIATDVGGNREAIEGAGILIPPASPQALSDAICSLLNPDQRDYYSYAALRAVKRFDLAVAEEKMAECYRQYRIWVRSRRR